MMQMPSNSEGRRDWVAVAGIMAFLTCCLLQIKLEYTIGGPFSLGSCPDNITEQQQHGEADSVRAGNDVKPQPTVSLLS